MRIIDKKEYPQFLRDYAQQGEDFKKLWMGEIDIKLLRDIASHIEELREKCDWEADLK